MLSDVEYSAGLGYIYNYYQMALSEEPQIKWIKTVSVKLNVNQFMFIRNCLEFVELNFKTWLFKDNFLSCTILWLLGIYIINVWINEWVNEWMNELIN